VEESLSFKDQIRLYPNPTTGQFSFMFQQQPTSLKVNVRNSNGSLVQSSRFSGQNEIDLIIQGAPGLYFVQLTNEKGEIANLKVIKR